jgi:CheY-like chemotaxis protein
MVTDTGVGIDTDNLEKIFVPYFTTKTRGKGTGLGLAVAYGIVKDFHGNIIVKSTPKIGTTFIVYLPLIEPHHETVPIATVEVEKGGNERILLVDDEEPIAYLEKTLLERLGYQVTAHTGSVDALETFKTHLDQFDLVISDMTMPNMTGDELARQLIAIRSDIPVIICTGFSERIDQNKAAAMGIKGFIMKPIVKADLARMVRKVLDGMDVAAG